MERDGFTHADHRLENVIGRRAGRSRRQLVLVAARDARGVPDVAGSASDTAALLELARVFQGRPTDLTLVLASVDGAVLGEVGAERLAGSLGSPDLVEAVIVMSNLGASTQRGSVIVPWSNDTTRGGIGLQRTLAESIREELEQRVESTGVAGQLSRLAFPLGIGSQGPFLDEGFEALRVSGSGELPPDGAADGGGQRHARRARPGRAAHRDRDRPARQRRARPADLRHRGQPGDAGLAAGAARRSPCCCPRWWPRWTPSRVSRRRREPVAAWLRWLGVWCVPFVAALGRGRAARARGRHAGAAARSRRRPPTSRSTDRRVAVLCGVVVLAAGSFWLARRLIVRSDPRVADPGRPGAATALALVTSITAVLLWFVNPFAALLAVPAVHLWMLATLTETLPPRRVRGLMVAVGVLPALLVATYHLFVLHVDPLSGAWYLLLLVTGHVVGLVSALIGCVWLGALCAAFAIVRSSRDPERPSAREGPRVYGPGSYAGPGSLGGTESAIKR